MANEIGTTLLNTLTNSTFDIGGMAKTLAEAEVAGPRSIVERNQEEATTELDAFSYLKLNLEAVNTYVGELSNPDNFTTKLATSSNESVLSVTANADAVAGSYSMEVRQLAQYHSQVVNQSYSSAYDSISNGTLNISVSGQSHDITVDSSNNTLDGLARYINSGDFGVNASVINNGGAYQLMFSSKQQGAAGEMSISGLPDFNAAGMTTTAEAQDAIMVVNGLAVANDSNSFDEVIPGLTLNANSAAIGQTVNVNIADDKESVKENITAFVDVFNQLDTILDELASYDTDELTEEQLESEEYMYYGDLAGNSTLKQARTQIYEALSGSISEISGSFNSLAVIGIERDLEGQLTLDEAKLDEVIATNFDALKNLFAKGGSSEDGLVNVLNGSDQTVTGSYQLEVTQLAERAVVTTGGYSTSANERVAGDRVVDMNSALTLDASASLNMSVGGVPNTVDLSSIAADYEDKDSLAAAIQAQIDTTYGGSSGVTVAYDTTQARFEFTSNAGEVTINSATGMSAQGFSTGQAYDGQALLNLTDSSNLSFDIQVDDSEVATVSIADASYTADEFAVAMANAINNNQTIKDSGNTVSVSNNGTEFDVASSRFGAFSKIDISAVSAGMTGSGVAVALDQGQSVDGTITTATGTMNIGAYADIEDGRRIKISEFAFIGSDAAEVRGLEFEVLGGQYDAGGALITDRGEVSYASGFGARLEDTINDLFDPDTGIVQRRVDYLSTKMDEYSDKTKDIDERYNLLEEKYRLQFSMLQTILSNAQATRDSLSAQFSGSN